MCELLVTTNHAQTAAAARPHGRALLAADACVRTADAAVQKDRQGTHHLWHSHQGRRPVLLASGNGCVQLCSNRRTERRQSRKFTSVVLWVLLLSWPPCRLRVPPADRRNHIKLYEAADNALRGAACAAGH